MHRYGIVSLGLATVTTVLLAACTTNTSPAGPCDGKTAEECARLAGAMDAALPDGTADSATSATLTINMRRFTGVFEVNATLTNVSSSFALPVSAGLFSVEDHKGRIYRVTGTCGNAAALAAGGSAECQLSAAMDDVAPKTLRFTGGVNLEAVVPFSFAECRLALEDSAEACNDGCSNDLNPYVDCDDRACCGVRTGCPADSYCGKRQ